MLSRETEDILSRAKETGWVLEPEAKRILNLAGIPTPRFAWVSTPEEAVESVRRIGYPVVAKVVSPKAIHKSDSGGVVLGITDDGALKEAFRRFSSFEEFRGVLIDETVSGLELIAGARVDFQFGPVILLGMGGTGVEIYGDAVLRMAPLREEDVTSMIRGLKAHALLEGYRGGDPVDLESLTRLMMTFSGLVMEIQDRIESIDLNPVMCTPKGCLAADARIMMRAEEEPAT